MGLSDHYTKEKQRFVDRCTRCGACAEVCPILPHADIGKWPSTEIQEGVVDFIETGIPNPRAYTKAFACMACFKCTADICPENLNPMLVNELIKGAYIQNGWADTVCSDTGQSDSLHQVLSRIQVSAAEFSRITASSPKGEYRYVFFPGCNVYLQPEKILNAMDILVAIGDDIAFLPGLAHCCGDSHLFCGDVKAGSARADELIEAIADYNPQAVILWCPTCRCRFDKYIGPAAMDVPFGVLSFPQYLARHMHRLPLAGSAGDTLSVTLHEACKSAYTGIDCDDIRSVLNQLPGVYLKEMAHHGADTRCCGSGAIAWFPESCAEFRKDRLSEAERTGARRMVTVCHYCSQAFAADAASSAYGFEVVNYINMVAEAVGIHRKDKFQQYMCWGDTDRILDDAAGRIAELPFTEQRIVEILQSVFTKANDH